MILVEIAYDRVLFIFLLLFFRFGLQVITGDWVGFGGGGLHLIVGDRVGIGGGGLWVWGVDGVLILFFSPTVVGCKPRWLWFFIYL